MFLQHIGTPHEGWTPHSGRFVYGTGKKWEKRHTEWLALAEEREKYYREHPEACVDKRTGKPVTWQVATAQSFSTKENPISTQSYRALKSIHKNGKRLEDIRTCKNLSENEGLNPSEISRITGISRSQVVNYLEPNAETKTTKTRTSADRIEDVIEQRTYVDISEGVERQLGISKARMDAVKQTLLDDGYTIQDIKIPQVTNKNNKTTVTVATPPGLTKKDIWDNREKIVTPEGMWFDDYEGVIVSRKPISSIDSSRIAINYAEDTGKEKDGLIEIRPGVADLSLGDRTYAQVRIAVDDTHYLKGMAVYATDYTNMPDGVDIVFNTNKHKGTPMCGPKNNTVLKPLKHDIDDPEKIDQFSPFGANTKQWDYIGEDGAKHQSPIEIVNDASTWQKWNTTLSTQVLSKQPPEIARRQLSETFKDKRAEFEDLQKITNPTLKRIMLSEFADSCDSDCVEMKAKAVPGQTTNVIIPIPSLKDDEIYAPGYENGTKVITIRFPHQGKFEIAELRVNNNNREGKAVLGNVPLNAVGMNARPAEIMSGADFDGDTCLVIPVKDQPFQVDKIHRIKDFDPKELYKKDDSQVPTGPKKDGGDGFMKGRVMGATTNLLTDMGTMGAPWEEIEKVTKHCLVVIDAEKHNLDWKKSEQDNDILALKRKWQGGGNKGGATLFTRGGSKADFPERREAKYYELTDEEKELWNAGKKIYRETGATRIDKNGKEVLKTEKDYRINRVDRLDLDSPLIYGSAIEEVYMEYVNNLKSLGEEARAEARHTGNLSHNKTAAIIYKDEVDSIEAKLNRAALNPPRERQAQAIASKNVELRIKADPRLDPKKNGEDKEAMDKLKKIQNRELAAARIKTGAKRNPIELTKKEYEAIDAGAITSTMFEEILRYTDKNKVKALALGQEQTALTDAKLSRARDLISKGKTWDDVAKQLDVSVSTLKNAIYPPKDKEVD